MLSPENQHAPIFRINEKILVEGQGIITAVFLSLGTGLKSGFEEYGPRILSEKNLECRPDFRSCGQSTSQTIHSYTY